MASTIPQTWLSNGVAFSVTSGLLYYLTRLRRHIHLIDTHQIYVRAEQRRRWVKPGYVAYPKSQIILLQTPASSMLKILRASKGCANLCYQTEVLQLAEISRMFMRIRYFSRSSKVCSWYRNSGQALIDVFSQNLNAYNSAFSLVSAPEAADKLTCIMRLQSFASTRQCGESFLVRMVNGLC